MTYRNSRLKHVNKIKDICADAYIRKDGFVTQILDQCRLLLQEKKKRKVKLREIKETFTKGDWKSTMDMENNDYRIRHLAEKVSEIISWSKEVNNKLNK